MWNVYSLPWKYAETHPYPFMPTLIFAHHDILTNFDYYFSIPCICSGGQNCGLNGKALTGERWCQPQWLNVISTSASGFMTELQLRSRRWYNDQRCKLIQVDSSIQVMTSSQLWCKTSDAFVKHTASLFQSWRISCTVALMITASCSVDLRLYSQK